MTLSVHITAIYSGNKKCKTYQDASDCEVRRSDGQQAYVIIYDRHVSDFVMVLTQFDVHITVHRVKFLTIKPTGCTNFSNLFLKWKSTCFGQFLCQSAGVFHCTHSSGICHTGLLTACEQDQDGTCINAGLRPVKRQNNYESKKTKGTSYRVRLRLDGVQFHPGPARKLSANLYDIYHCCVYSEKLLVMDRGNVRNM